MCTTGPGQRTLLLRRLLIALSRNTRMVPRSFLIHGIHLQVRDAVSGGGFADIFRATYRGQSVALKRLRNFSNTPISESEESVSNIHQLLSVTIRIDGNQAFRREALVSSFLEHPNIQPFIGIDKTTFHPLFCIVSPWQQNGNILTWLKFFEALGLQILIDACVRQNSK